MTLSEIFVYEDAVPDTPTIADVSRSVKQGGNGLDETYLPARKANAFNLLSMTMKLPPPGEIIVNPNDGGISFHWDRYELAVYEDYYETYLFSDGDTVIHHWPHLPEEVHDDAMISELKMATS